ncbi:MAG TPA: diguanylate cyclase, partial [Gammaproteobacteria bacterium]|nr:diguanylate cyclase [Gammaproteobacteria bacterium]
MAILRGLFFDRRVLRRFLVLFLPVAVTAGAVFGAFHYQDIKGEHQAISLRETAGVDLARRSVSRDFDAVVSDLRVLAGRTDVRALAGSPHDAAGAARVAGAKRLYDQVRYLDERGREVVRVDYNSGHPRVVPARQLQDKSARYYFRDARSLPAGGVYVSRFDLNVERGRVEQPPKPVIRFATPVTDLQGRKRGVLVLNYLGRRLIDNLRRALDSTPGIPMLLDEGGYWLYAPDGDLTWGFMQDHGRRFSDLYPGAWRQISEQDSGQITNRLGMFSFATIYPLWEVAAFLDGDPPATVRGPQGRTANTQFWKIVSHVERDALGLPSYRRAETGLVIYLMLIGLWSVASGQIARLRARDERSRELIDRLSSVVEQTSDIVYITDPDGTIEYVNPSFERLTGYSRDQAVGRSAAILSAGEQDAEYYRNMWKTIRAGQSFQDVLINHTRSGEVYYEQKTITPLRDTRGVIRHFVSTGKDITEQMVAQERLYHLAFHNPLTNLPNRNLFRDRLARAAVHANRTGRMVALMLLDLDEFKAVNDSLGHEAGDRLLEQVSERLRNCVRETDTVAHVGGDEFALILEDIEHGEQAVRVAEEIHRRFTEGFRVEGSEVFIGIAVGIVLYPLDETGTDSLIRAADTAMYHAKALGRNRYAFYSEDMTRKVSERLRMETDLRHALERAQFAVHYQPVVSLTTGRIDAVEALLRWHHPERGLLDPGQFIPVLEDSGLILQSTAWLLREVCSHAAALRAAGHR